ncbi:MAG: UDP-glucose 6-dehydrogenase [Acidobacteria bacterium]|nr:MAG: UDP-glucose 6-dehydrogenase [Acidobacteriota bacterium]PYQ20537.1 MAG: UDP-glucose 6-dehydrogenase [Acidobacteriota bacterium]
MRIAVVGTGYVGLVVGTCLAENGNTVVCVDNDEGKIAALRRGEMPIYEPGLDEMIPRNVAEERLSFSTDLAAAVRASEIVFIAVGTPQGEDGSADMTHVLAVAEGVGRAMNGYKVLVNKSTVPVGTARRVREVVSRLTSHPFSIVSNPEFLKEGVAIDDFLKPDRVVVGTDDPRAEAVMRELYAPFVRTGNPILVMDLASAELTKYAANAMLASRISFMNEIASLCDRVGADVGEVRKGIGTDSRIGSSFLFPGIGYGGSCFPKDVKALRLMGREAGLPLHVVTAVDLVNDAQRVVLVPRIEAHLGGLPGKVIAVWGLAFKPRTDDLREAPALAVIEALLARGAAVRAYDPKAVPAARRLLGDRVTFCHRSYEAVEGADALVLATEWNEFREPDFERVRALMRRPAIFDGRNIYNPRHLRELGFHYEGVGRR